MHISELNGFVTHKKYFEEDDKKFKPYMTTFTSDYYKNIITINYIQFTECDHDFAFKFWRFYTKNHLPRSINYLAIAYWGEMARQGQISGDEVENYIPWFVKNINCIPTLLGECKNTKSVFLNTKEIIIISGKYLSVFNGPELSQDWKSFFNFRTALELSDYLELLSKISADIDENNEIKKDNYERIQSIYSILLSKCENWGEEEIKKVRNWSTTGHLLNTKKQFMECNILKYYIDGNEVIFQDSLSFMNINAENKNNKSLEIFLGYFNVEVLKQSGFELICDQTEVCVDLKSQLDMVLPYLKIWINYEDYNNSSLESVKNLQEKIRVLEIYQAKELKITYENIDFIKIVNIHINKTNLYVTDPWYSNSVLLKLSEILCRYFDIVGHDKKLDFLLRCSEEEIQKYFKQEEIEIPKEFMEKMFLRKEDVEVSSEFNHTSKQNLDALRFIESRIPKAVENIISHLNALSEYDCSHNYMITNSIIGGIIKNGNEIAVLARPSDNNQVIIYDDTEFDILDYVDSEFWCEDGYNIPKQITLGQLIKKIGINKIPISNTELELSVLQNNPKSEILDFNPVPFVPEKIAKIISSFANTNGGTLIFGLKKVDSTSNGIVGLSFDFDSVKITNRAVSMLNPIPNVTYDWVKIEDKYVFVIKTEKSNERIMIGNQIFIRKNNNSILEENNLIYKKELNMPTFDNTVAIIVAIENYTTRPNKQVSTVLYANNDAEIFKKMLIDSMEVKEENIFMFSNEQALKSNMQNDVKYHIKALSATDRLIFYYVGHGFHNGITNYLSTFDMHPDNIENSAISLDEISLGPLKNTSCQNALIFIDACASKIINNNSRNHITSINTEEFTLLTHDFPNYAMFLSCQTGQSSYSSNTLKNGIWTHHLVNALTGNVTEVLFNNRYVTDRLLQDYLYRSVTEYTMKEFGHEQNPKSILDSSNENIIVEI